MLVDGPRAASHAVLRWSGRPRTEFAPWALLRDRGFDFPPGAIALTSSALARATHLFTTAIGGSTNCYKSTAGTWHSTGNMNRALMRALPWVEIGTDALVPTGADLSPQNSEASTVVTGPDRTGAVGGT